MRRAALVAVGALSALAGLRAAMQGAQALYLARARALYGPAYSFVKVDPLVNTKLDYFAAHKDDYTTLFIGDSTIYRDVDPVRYDRLMRAAGVDSKSFNLGLTGMRVFEAHYLLRWVAGLHPRRLRTIVVGTSYHPLKGEDADLFRKSLREVYWRDLDETSREIGSHLESSEPPAVSLRKSARALVMFLSRCGRLALVLSARPAPYTPHPDLKLDEDQGFLPVELDHGDNKREEYLRGRERFQSDLEAFAKAPRPPRPPYPARSAGFQAIRGLAREQGWALTFVRPFFDEPDSPTGCEDPGAGCSFLDFSDARRYAGFYRYERYFDFRHLRLAAAEDFTGLIASRMAALEREGR